MMPFIMSSPPPIDECEEEDDDEFGDFSAADRNFSLTGLNQTSDSPDIEKPWIYTPDIKKEKDIPGISSSNISAFTSKETEPDSCVEPFANHIYLKNSDGTVFEKPSSSCYENKNSQSDDVVQSVSIKSFLLDSQVEEINLNSQVVTCCKSIEDKNDMLVVKSTEKAEDGVNRAEKLKPESNIVSNINKVDINSDDDDFSEFADFKSGANNFENAEVKDFGASTKILTCAVDDFDGFDEFDDFESVSFTSSNTKNELTVEDTLKMMFESPKENSDEPSKDATELTDSLHSCLDDSSSVWGHLKELETSHALNYQWSNSTANKSLLSSLNVDCRNILFGARWNHCLPRFAANLGINPLEPVKATETNSLPQVIPLSTCSTAEELVPAAQFDWTGSGLTNPLDASHLTLLDLDFFTKFDDISSSSHAASSFWNHSSLEKENASSSANETSVSPVIDALVVDSVKPVVSDIFGSIRDEVIDEEVDETVAPSVLHPAISSIPGPDSGRSSEMSSEAYAIVESFPDLSFLSARKLMHAADENMSRWRLKP